MCQSCREHGLSLFGRSDCDKQKEKKKEKRKEKKTPRKDMHMSLSRQRNGQRNSSKHIGDTRLISIGQTHAMEGALTVLVLDRCTSLRDHHHPAIHLPIRTTLPSETDLLKCPGFRISSLPPACCRVFQPK